MGRGREGISCAEDLEPAWQTSCDLHARGESEENPVYYLILKKIKKIRLLMDSPIFHGMRRVLHD